MKNKAKYFSCLIFLLLMALFTTVSKGQGVVFTQTNNIFAFEPGDHSLNSAAEVTSLNYGGLSSITNTSRRITRSNNYQTQPYFGNIAVLCNKEQSTVFPTIIAINTPTYNKHVGKNYIYSICCIRI